MKRITRKIPTTAVHFILGLISLSLLAMGTHAASFKMADGSTAEGEIQFTTSGSVFLRTAPDSIQRIKKKELDPAELATIEGWESGNSLNARLSTKFDAQPQPVKMKSPERKGEIAKLSGVVMMAVVVDEKGTVEDAYVRQSSDPRFNEPSVAAVKNWAFSPLTLDSKPTRGLMFVPMQY